jgi:hypothetical protein
LQNKPEECQKIIDLGMDPSEPCGDGFENGDGEHAVLCCVCCDIHAVVNCRVCGAWWELAGFGEMEYIDFTAMNFAAANGKNWRCRDWRCRIVSLFFIWMQVR